MRNMCIPESTTAAVQGGARATAKGKPLFYLLTSQAPMQPCAALRFPPAATPDPSGNEICRINKDLLISAPFVAPQIVP
jgi:hypothetical protein